MKDRNIIVKITKTKMTKDGEIEQSFIDIEATIREGFDFFNEMMLDALMGETKEECKEKAEIARYTASKKFVDALGIPWKAVNHIISFMSMGDEKQAFATARRCML